VCVCVRVRVCVCVTVSLCCYQSLRRCTHSLRVWASKRIYVRITH